MSYGGKAVLGRGACAVVALFLAGCSQSPVGKAAPQFTLNDPLDRPWSLGERSGKPVMLYFWATWAPPSRMGFDPIIRLQAVYRKHGIEVAGIAVRDERRQVSRFLREKRPNFPVLFGTEEVEKAYFADGKVRLPMILVIDRRGIVVARFIGYQAVVDLEPMVARVTGASMPAKENGHGKR